MGTSTERVQLVVNAKDQASGVLNKIKSGVIGIGAAYLGWRAITGILGSIVEKGKAHEQAWNDVAAALERHGHEVDSNVEKIKNFSDQMQTMTGESDEVIGKSIQTFIDYGMTVDEAMSVVKTGLDFAAGSGRNLATATQLLAKAYVGSTGELSRYGIVLDESIPKADKFAAAVGQMNDLFGGAAQARAETMAVKLSVVSERFGDLQEELFKIMSPALVPALDMITNALEGLRWVVQGFLPVTLEAQEKTADFADEIRNAEDPFVRYQELIAEAGDDVNLLTAAHEAAIASLLQLAATTEGVRAFEEIASGAHTAQMSMEELQQFIETEWNNSLRETQKIASDATNVIIGGLDQQSKAFEELTADVELTKEEIDALFKGMVEGAGEAGAAFRKLTKEERKALDKVMEDTKKFAQDQIDYYEEIDDALEKYLNNVKVKTIQTFERVSKIRGAYVAAQERFLGTVLGNMQSQVDNLVDDIAESFVEGGESLKEIFQDWSKIFLKNFIANAIRFVADFIAQLLARSESDLLKHLSGLFSIVGGRPMEEWPGGNVAPNITGGGITGGAATGTIFQIAFNGPVTSPNFVQQQLLPELEAAVFGNISVLTRGESLVTGTDNVIFA